MTKITKQTWTTQLPLTAQAKEAFLDKYFAQELPHYSELFIPDDNFYINASAAEQARVMLDKLCRFLGIKPGYIGLELEALGGDIPDGRRHTIYIETQDLENEFVLGAVLACSLTRYLLEERKQILLPSAEQTALLASATVVFGLGVVVANGLSPWHSWHDAQKTSNLDDPRMFRKFPVSGYTNLLLGFIRKHGINSVAFVHTLTPWTAHRLQIQPTKQLTHAALEASHQLKLSRYKFWGVAWLAILVLGLVSITAIIRVKPAPAKLTQAQEQVNLLAELTGLCKDTLAYDRRYVDTTDIQTMRSLNAEALRCESLNNQYDAAQQAYQALAGK